MHASTPTPSPSGKPRWRDTLAVYLEPASLRMLSLGFSAGLPLLLIIGTLSFRLREAGIDRSTIGFLSWIGLTYAFKWSWAPLVDRLALPLLTARLGQRRSWLLLAQTIIISGLVCMALTDPQQALRGLVLCAVAVAFGSATQDIALDAFRIESADMQRQAALSATYQTGYRLDMIWAGAGSLWIAARASVEGQLHAQAQAHAQAHYQQGAWQAAYLVMALSMLPGVLTVLYSREPVPRSFVASPGIGAWLHSALVEPFAEFLRRYGWQALLVLALIATYRISDVVMGNMANPFYVDMGYTKDEVAMVTKIYGVFMTLAGGFIGGALALRMGVSRVLMLGACMSIASNLLYSWLAGQGHDVLKLVFVISADNLSSGLASSAFIAYLSSLTNIRYSATQYAMFSSMMLLVPKFAGGYSGVYVDHFGYSSFFAGTAMLGLPVLVLVWFATRVVARPAS